MNALASELPSSRKEETVTIGDMVRVHRNKKRWTYFLGLPPIYSHDADDERMFRLTTVMLIDSGPCRHCDSYQTFGVSKSSVDRSLRKYRQTGIGAFFQRKPSGRKATVFTPPVLEQAHSLRSAPRRRCCRRLGLLRVRIHNASTPATNRALAPYSTS